LREARMGRASSSSSLSSGGPIGVGGGGTSFGGGTGGAGFGREGATRRETDGSRSTAGGFAGPVARTRGPSSLASSSEFLRVERVGDETDGGSRSSSFAPVSHRRDPGHARDGAMSSYAPLPASSPIPGPPPPPPPPPGAASRPASAASASSKNYSSSSRRSNGSVAEGARESANELVNALAAGGRGMSSSTSR